MNFTSNLIIDLYSAVILICIYIHTDKDAEKNLLQHKLYRQMLQLTVLMLILDIFSRFDGNPTTIYFPINYIGNFLIFLVSPCMTSLWLFYCDFQVFHEEKRVKRLLSPLLAVNLVNAVLLIVSLFCGWFYYIDSNNIYHRGPLYWVPVSITIALTLASFILVATHHEKIGKKHFLALAFFPIPPVVGIILQLIFYGTPFILIGLTVSLLIVFLNIQNRSMNIDYLTGAYNRRGLEIHMREQVNASSEDKTFSAIWIDLDNFKSINDTFGHNTGDQVLETVVQLLRSCFRPTDFIARFGGDEFCIILNISNSEDLEAAVARIKDCVRNYNSRTLHTYKLSLSIGAAVYDYGFHLRVEEFQKQIDELMYQDKQAKKQIPVKF